MFISKKRTKRNPNVYVQLVESYRNEAGKVRQRVIKHIGSAVTEEQLGKVVSLGNEVKAKILSGVCDDEINALIKQALSKIKGSRSLILNCEPIKVINKGVMDIYGQVFDDMGLHSLIQSRSNYEEVLKDIVLGRVLSFGSKRKTAEQLSKKLDKHHHLNSIYRTMDKINAQVIEKLQEKVSQYNKTLLGGSIKVLFYNATTLYFESFNDDELRQLGYSKDLKFNQPQIVLTLLVSEEGLPLAYQVFPGNTYEGNTLQKALKSWKKLYPSQTITLVADSGILNSINLDYLEKEGYQYIVCARLKNFSRPIKAKICSSKDLYCEDYFHEISLGHRRLIISYRENRALKDRNDREKNISKLKKKLMTSRSPSALISNYGYKKYISIHQDTEIVLNEEKIQEAEQWDGLHGVISNIQAIDPEQVYRHYRGLYLIEDAFRINKTDLKIRPIFHWTAERIQSHIAISYMAFSCYKAVEYQYNKTQKHPLSHRQIREALCETSVVIYQDKYSEEQFSMPLPIPKVSHAIYASQNKPLDLRPHTVVA